MNTVQTAIERNDIHASIIDCTRCPYHSANQRITFRGPTPNRIMMITPPPDSSEERWGAPLISAAGKWFESQLSEYKLPPLKKWYVTSVIKCRPTLDEKPDSYTYHQCSAHLRREVGLVDPEWVVTLGIPALESVGVKGKLADFHGRPFLMTAGPFAGRYVFPTYDPGNAYREGGDVKLLADLATLKKLFEGSDVGAMRVTVGRGGKLVKPDEKG